MIVLGDGDRKKFTSIVPGKQETVEPTPGGPLSSDMSWQMQAVHLFAQCGSFAEVSRQMGKTLYELQKLSRTSWWQEEFNLLRREETALSNVKMSRILDKSLEELSERLEFGDTVVNEGQTFNIPIPAKDLVRIIDVIFNKRQLIRGEPTMIEGDNKKLADLAEKLRTIGEARIQENRNPQLANSNITDAVIIEGHVHGKKAG